MGIESSLDQNVALTSTDRATIEQVDAILEKARLTGDPGVALKWGSGLNRSAHVIGLATAKLLYGLKQEWEHFATDTTFEDAVTTDIGYSVETTRKYVALWEALFENPAISDSIKEGLMGKPIRSLLLLTGAAKDGNFVEAEWREVVNAPDAATVSAMVRAKRGTQTSSETQLVIIWERDGRVKCRKGSTGKYEDMGFLDRAAKGIVADAIDRIVRTAGIVVR